MVRIRKGSVRLTVSLSAEAARTLLALRAQGQLTRICGFAVSAIEGIQTAERTRAVALSAVGGSSTAQRTRAVTVVSAWATAVDESDMVNLEAPSGTVRSWANAGEFAVLAALHKPTLLRVALRLSNDTDSAKDLVQETLVRGLEHFKFVWPGADIRGWLVTILTNQYLDRLKSRRHGTKVPEPSVPVEVESMAEISEADLHAAICALEPELREVVELCYLKQLRYREAARMLNVPVATIGTRLMRARRRLQELLKRYEAP
jgi:RNA polymerase sigma-70 factor (ECF subfamily)